MVLGNDKKLGTKVPIYCLSITYLLPVNRCKTSFF